MINNLIGENALQTHFIYASYKDGGLNIPEQ
jgi:hypothetical protein